MNNLIMSSGKDKGKDKVVDTDDWDLIFHDKDPLVGVTENIVTDVLDAVLEYCDEYMRQHIMNLDDEIRYLAIPKVRGKIDTVLEAFDSQGDNKSATFP